MITANSVTDSESGGVACGRDNRGKGGGPVPVPGRPRRRWKYASREAAEAACARAEAEVDVCRVALLELARGGFMWSGRFSGGGSVFSAGVARVNGATGGVILVRAKYGTQEGQEAYGLEDWLRNEIAYYDCRYISSNEKEAQARRDLFWWVREEVNRQRKKGGV